MTITLTAENILGIHKLQNEDAIRGYRLDFSDVGREVKHSTLEDKDHYLQGNGLTLDQATKHGRKAAIKCAKFMYRFDDNIEKPSEFALLYLKGYFDNLPEVVVAQFRRIHKEYDLPRLGMVTRLQGRRAKFGDPTGDHYMVTRVSATPETYGISVIKGGHEVHSAIIGVKTNLPTMWYS